MCASACVYVLKCEERRRRMKKVVYQVWNQSAALFHCECRYLSHSLILRNLRLEVSRRRGPLFKRYSWNANGNSPDQNMFFGRKLTVLAAYRQQVAGE